ncbi:hypothetical protein [Amnibacterium kyonggiense]|uniref:Uncharacterized protein n=1 Tax=Amnibacterium kyonggiense TaxID=595671 RepID=A0A4R7FJ95_9MICO|nr:hypothetical protein [Amnibacterium kyonggiense]TDS75926.1 hypothetical protein CLV52_3037 [Amnibacterium kyonggiense]
MSVAVGSIVVGGQRFDFAEHDWDESELEAGPPVFDLLVDLPPQLGIDVQRQGPRCDGAWGVDLELHTHKGAVTPGEARRWAHAVIAAAALAERFEEQRTGAAS